jgi:hypothetical protein
MDAKLTVVPDCEFEMLTRLGDYEDPGTGCLTRVEGDICYIVFPQSVWDGYQSSVAQVEAECAGLVRSVASYSQFEGGKLPVLIEHLNGIPSDR